MTTVAVTAASSPTGRALLARLDADPAVERVVGLDAEPPPMPPATLDFRACDLRDPVLAAQLEGVDALVHLGCDDRLDADVDGRFGRTVAATRNLLAAARHAGVRQVVHRSSALVYGAHPDNPVPLDESWPRRANPEYPPAHHHRLAEELVEDFADEHGDARVALLRPPTVLGRGEDSPVALHLQLPRLLTVAGHEPPLQVLHPDDLAAALHHAVSAGLHGVRNVAAEGWLPLGDVATLVGRRRLTVPEAWAHAGARQLWRRRLWPLPPGGLAILMEPWVVRAEALRGEGWAATRSNREVLRAFAEEHRGWVRLGAGRQVRRRDLRLAGAGVAAGAAGAAALTRRAKRR